VLADCTLDAVLLDVFELSRPQVDPEWERRQRRKVDGGVAEIARLVGERPFAMAGRFTLADAAVGALLGSLSMSAGKYDGVPGSDWRERHPALGRYFDRLDQRPSFVATRPVMFDFDFTKGAARAA
jgi:glutathione S-transferase